MSMFNPVIHGNEKPVKRSGHISVFYKGLFIVFGGYNGRHLRNREEIDDEDVLESSDIWCYSVEASKWRRYATKGEQPGPISGSCAALLGDEIYLFAGFKKQKKEPTNNLYSLDLKTLTWRDCTSEAEGSPPSPRDKFGCWKFRQKLIYFGGFGRPPSPSSKGEFCYDYRHFGQVGWNNELHVLDISESISWSQPDCTGDVPCPRAAFALAQVEHMGYMFGGRFQDVRRNDMYCIDLRTYTWREFKLDVTPRGRSWHVLVPVSNNHLFMYGGLDSNDTTLKDVWIFDIRNTLWIELENATCNLDYSAERLWHSACRTDCTGEIVIFGGCSYIEGEGVVEADFNNIVSIFRFSPISLRRLCLNAIGEKK